MFLFDMLHISMLGWMLLLSVLIAELEATPTPEGQYHPELPKDVSDAWWSSLVITLLSLCCYFICCFAIICLIVWVVSKCSKFEQIYLLVLTSLQVSDYS